jgi:hypothetical protein
MFASVQALHFSETASEHHDDPCWPCKNAVPSEACEHLPPGHSVCVTVSLDMSVYVAPSRL